jgi:hypothetical protein
LSIDRACPIVGNVIDLKFIPYLLPLISACAVCVWIFPQRGALVAAEMERLTLSAKSRSDRGSATVPAPSPHGETSRPESLPDWEKTARRIEQLSTAAGPESKKQLSAFIGQFDAMTADEILAVLGKIADVKTEDRAMVRLEMLLMASLVRKDPQLAFELPGDRLASKPHLDSILHAAYKIWADGDPEKAIAWLDGLINDGGFDHTLINQSNPSWLGYETALISSLMVHDLPRASLRLEGLPQRDRVGILTFGMGMGVMDATSRKAYARLCHDFLTEEEIGVVMDRMANLAIHTGGYEAAAAVLADFQPTPEEKERIVGNVAIHPLEKLAASRKITEQDIEGVRKWAASQGSQRVDRITGRAIGAVAGSPSTDLAEAYKLIRIYHARSGSDALLVGFLRWPAVRKNLTESQQLLMMIRDTTLRNEVEKEFE